MRTSISHREDLVRGFYVSGVYNGGLEILHLAAPVFLFYLDCLCICNDDNDYDHAHHRITRER